MIEPVVFLDHDGVFVDFVGAALRVHGSALTPEDITYYDMATIMGITGPEFWKPIDAAGVEFWRDLPEYPWAEALYTALCSIPAEVVFLTRPSWSWTTIAGKKMWFDRKFGKGFRNFIPTYRKELLAHHPRCVLVDDSPDNVEGFIKAGGKAVLFPQPWNGTSVPEGANVVDYIVARVKIALAPW